MHDNALNKSDHEPSAVGPHPDLVKVDDSV